MTIKLQKQLKFSKFQIIMLQKPDVSIIIPAFNEEASIGDLLTDLQEKGFTSKYEVLVVDDGSTDNTAAIIKEFPVKLVSHGSNKGYGAALKSGVRRAKGDKVIMLDSDGQHDPVYIDQLIPMLADYDMVIGERGVDSYHVSNRKKGKYIIRKVGEYLVDQTLPDYNSGFRGFDRELIASMLHIMPNGFSFSTTSTLAFLKEGYSIGRLPIKVIERQGRPSSVSFVKDGPKTFLLLFRIIMLFNPMKIFFPGSIAASVAGLLWGFYGYHVYGRFAISGTVLLTFGMFMFFFGLIADQIAILNRKKSA
jgi:glycosyltransferase involved in cell wall biosynthesis